MDFDDPSFFSKKKDVRFSYMFVEQVLKKSKNKEVFYKF
jgi:hypothetical protein